VSSDLPETMISLDSIAFRWRPTDPLALDIASLRILDGERVFLQGASGSGKTSLLNLLAGVVLPQKGNVEIRGQALHQLSPAKRDQFRADHMGLIFQIFNLLPYLDLIENVCLPLQFSKRRRRRAIERDGSERQAAEQLLLALDIPESLFSGRAVSELSTGQQQRVAAARALIGEPEIILADEPTSALDNANTHLFLELLFAELAKTTAALVFVSHDDRLSEHFDRHLTMTEIQRDQGAAS